MFLAIHLSYLYVPTYQNPISCDSRHTFPHNTASFCEYFQNRLLLDSALFVYNVVWIHKMWTWIMFQKFISSHNEQPSPTHQQTEWHWAYALKTFDLGSNVRSWICYACWFCLISSITSMAPLIHILGCQAPWFHVLNSWNLHFSHHSKGRRERGSGPGLHGAPGPDGVLLPPDPFTVSSYPQGFPVLHQGHHHRQADGEGERVSGSNCCNAFTNSIINLHGSNIDMCVCICCRVFLSRFPISLFKSISRSIHMSEYMFCFTQILKNNEICQSISLACEPVVVLHSSRGSLCSLQPSDRLWPCSMCTSLVCVQERSGIGIFFSGTFYQWISRFFFSFKAYLYRMFTSCRRTPE